MSGRRDPSMSARRANSSRPLCGDGLTNVTNARDSDRRETDRPFDRRLERRADEPDSVAVELGQELAAGEGVIDVLEVARVVVAKPSHGEGRGDAARPRPRHAPPGSSGGRCRRSADRARSRQQSVEQRQVLRCLARDPAAIRRCAASSAASPARRSTRVAHDRTRAVVRRDCARRSRCDAVDACARCSSIVNVTRALEARGREDVAGMPGVREPLDDRAQALRHAGGRIADAVVVDEEKSHAERTTANRRVNTRSRTHQGVSNMSQEVVRPSCRKRPSSCWTDR